MAFHSETRSSAQESARFLENRAHIDTYSRWRERERERESDAESRADASTVVGEELVVVAEERRLRRTRSVFTLEREREGLTLRLFLFFLETNEVRRERTSCCETLAPASVVALSREKNNRKERERESPRVVFLSSVSSSSQDARLGVSSR